MTYIVSVIASPAHPTLSEELVNRLLELVKGDNATELAAGVAYDIATDNAPETETLGKLQSVALDVRADVNILPASGRRKKLLIADMDSTMIEQECIDELAEFAGKRAEISTITERAMRGELDFEGALKERVAMLKGLPESVLAKTFEKSISLTPGARSLVQTMNANGGVTALVSGGFTYFTGRVAELTGFQTNQANELLIEDGTLTGEVAMPILGREAKDEALQRIAADNSIDLSDTLAVGDGANDLSMLNRAGLGVAYHAKPAVAEAAHARINHSDLTALLYLQGIPQSEFCS